MQLTNEQVIAALEELGHRDIAEALAAKLEEDGEQPKDMNARIRSAAGREPAA